MQHKTFVRHYLLIAVLCLALVGCATVNSDSIVKFNGAVHQASTGIDAALSVNYNWTRSGFVEGFSADPKSNFSQLIIQPGMNYEWSMGKPPIYLDIKKTQASLSDLNGAFTQYASLLVKLSGGELVSTDTFDQLAKDINKNASDAATALKITVPSGNMALISTAASEAARLYIEHKRQGYLIDAIKNNQDLVQQYSDACIALIHIMRGNLKAYYADKLEPIKVAWNASSGSGRQQQTESMLSLNEQFASALSVLQELEKTYTALPKAHAELAKSINNPSLDLEGVQQLYSSGMRLQRLYTELKKTS
jgi:hypothetical protein